ncbi:RNase H domain-containing protein [Trichonephila clavipes]|nr:RNase H domain-containing protein [Trichonephila clavipes]
MKIAREEDSLNESTPVSKRSRRRKTSKTLDTMDTDAEPSDTDYVIDDVKDIIRQYHPVCVALQETFLKSCHTTKIRRYGCVRKDTEGSSVSGGVCIFTSLDVPSSALPLRTSLQAVAMRIHSTSLITVCCLYLPPNAVIHQQDLNNLVDQLPSPFVILGDFNGHSTLWGSVKTNPGGGQIEQVLSNHCLCLLNDEEPTYFHEPTRSFHTLDLAICSPSLLHNLNLSVEKDLYNSDHFLVILSHDYDTAGKTLPPTYSYSRADWALFTQLAVISDAMVKTESVDTFVQEVTNVLISAADLSIPKSSSHSFQRYKPWWNADCLIAYKNQRKLWGIFRRYPTTENLLVFKKAKANARRKKCERSPNILKVLSNTLWGADRISLLRVYQALILSRLDYGCVVYGSARTSVLKRLAQYIILLWCLQNFACYQLVCGMSSTTFRTKAEAIKCKLFYSCHMSVPSHPLKPFSLATDLTRLYEARSFNIKPFSERAKAVLNDAHLSNINIQENNILAFPPWDIRFFNYSDRFSGYDKADTADVIYQQLFSFHRNKYSKYIPVNTDGSKTAGHVGCVCVVLFLTIPL